MQSVSPSIWDTKSDTPSFFVNVFSIWLIDVHIDDIFLFPGAHFTDICLNARMDEKSHT